MRDYLRLDVYLMRPGRLRVLWRWDSTCLRKDNYLVRLLDLNRPVELLSLRLLPPAQLLDDVFGSADTLVLIAHLILRVLRLLFLILLLRILLA